MKVITFSASDGAGKTTACNYMAEQLEAKGYKVAKIREVGTPQIPECVKLRELILNPESKLNDLEMEVAFMVMALATSRWLKTEGQAYDFVISDRGLLDHYAYGYANITDKVEQEVFSKVLEAQTVMRVPSEVVYMQISQETARIRRVNRGLAVDKIEAKGEGFLAKVIENMEGWGFGLGLITHVVDANQSLEDVKKQLDAYIEELVKNA